MEGWNDGKVLEAYGRHELNNNDEPLLIFAKDNKLGALTNTFFGTRKGGISHMFKIVSSRNGQKRIGYILTQQAH